MRLSGFADEAADGIDGQIEATRALGWSCIEARSIDRVNIHDLPEPAFDDVRRKLDARESASTASARRSPAGARVSTSPSRTRWRPSTCDPADEGAGCAHVRVMSYAVLADDRGRALADQKRKSGFAACAKSAAVSSTRVSRRCTRTASTSAA